MPDRRELMLGGGQHTLYSDEVWYLVTAAGSGEVVLEVRFQSDAPDRTGYPSWAGTELCVTRIGEEAVGRLHYAGPAELLAAARPSFVPEGIWAKATEECRKLVPPSAG
jgi:hypothetical protein